MEKLYHPKIGLALGSGGARGFAHLGVIKVLNEENIPIDLIAGSSMGALVGALYTSGLDIDKLYKISSAFKRKYYLDFTVPKMGFIAGNRVKELIRMFTKNKNIEELDIPLSIVATDLLKAERVIFNQGPVASAVRASISIPGIFVPERIDGRILIDGGVIDKVPISVVKDMGADIVIAIDVSSVKIIEDITSIYDVILQSIEIMQNEVVNHKVMDADIMIRPLVTQYSTRAFTNIEEIIKTGEDSARLMVPQIKAVIEDWKEKKQKDE
ncbi:patatin-like phospholipase family protein [Bacillus sp. PS06]|uniref:patatin-like phospholipase family protein n=1 Tax=Bacillus sp. PS06 TaxID=2764176 RepID=UPI00177C1350|nr:patatin-like phospholipase family protein [Bacillus sp. PS06]MBD8068409.1 patatin-like phospholipase family protein [Bacillus sp. PS06]